MSNKNYENIELLKAIETVIEGEPRNYIPKMIEELGKDGLSVCRSLGVVKKRLIVEFDLYYDDNFVDEKRFEIAKKSLLDFGDNELTFDDADGLAEGDNQYWGEYYNPDQWVNTHSLEQELLTNLAKYLIGNNLPASSEQYVKEQDRLTKELRKLTKFYYEYDYGGYFYPEYYLDIVEEVRRGHIN